MQGRVGTEHEKSARKEGQRSGTPHAGTPSSGASSAGTPTASAGRARAERTSGALGQTAASTARAEKPLDRLFRSHAASLHLREGKPSDAPCPGCTLEMDPEWGAGGFWGFRVDDDMAVFSYELSLAKPLDAACLSPDYFSVTAQRRAHAVPAHAATAPAARGADRADAPVIGAAWKGQAFAPTPKENERLQVSGIVLLPRALQRMSLRCQCDPLMLSSAIASLDGTKSVPGLSAVLDDIAHARPSTVVARAYYESKVTEAMSLIVDWSISGKSARRVPLRAVDRTALNRARRFLADNLDRTVSTEELCSVACMSASKLTGLFKAAEGVTPQEYARALRMELACKLLARTDLPLSAVASRLGFQRQGSFSEAFKERFHLTPREYRNLSKEQQG